MLPRCVWWIALQDVFQFKINPDAVFWIPVCRTGAVLRGVRLLRGYCDDLARIDIIVRKPCSVNSVCQARRSRIGLLRGCHQDYDSQDPRQQERYLQRLRYGRQDNNGCCRRRVVAAAAPSEEDMMLFFTIGGAPSQKNLLVFYALCFRCMSLTSSRTPPVTCQETDIHVWLKTSDGYTEF